MSEVETEYSTPEECTELVNAIEQGVRDLVSTIKSGQFADVRARIAQLQTISTNFKSEVQRLPDLNRNPEQQQQQIKVLKEKIDKRNQTIAFVNEKITKLVAEHE